VHIIPDPLDQIKSWLSFRILGTIWGYVRVVNSILLLSLAFLFPLLVFLSLLLVFLPLCLPSSHCSSCSDAVASQRAKELGASEEIV
jgi:hypothetical protein